MSNGSTPYDLLPDRIFQSASGSTGSDSGPMDKEALLKALRRQSTFTQVPFVANNIQPILLRAQETRTYLLIQNTAAVGIIYLGFGYTPGAATGMPIVAGGYYEPFQVPQNDIWIFGSAVAVTGVLLFAS